jgi:ABC-2 type transport system ATP-binding protein
MDGGTAIEARNLRMTYVIRGARGVEPRRLDAVRGIDLSVREGEVFALLGPNGAGKTTTVEILEGFRTRTGGEVAVLGFDPGKRSRRLQEQVGIVLQSTGIDPYLTVAETVELYRGYYPAPRPLDEVLEVVGLTQKRDTRVLKLSGGQQRRLDVAIALAGDPRLLFLDEPTTGFDPSARRNAWEVVKNLEALGKTVFLTTHYMDEAQYLAKEVAIIAGGIIVARGSPASLGGRDTAATIVRFGAPEGGLGALPPSLRSIATAADRTIQLATEDPARTVHDLTGWALERGMRLEDLSVSRPSLEDVYLRITGGEAGVEE